MDGLRWLLLFFGILVIAGVYLYSRREKSPETDEEVLPERLEPTLRGESGATAPEDDESDTDDEDDATDVADVPQKIVTLRLIGHEKKPFKGDELVLSLRGIGLRHGKFGIFHRYDGNDDTKTIFSAASLVEPGSFDLANIAEQRIPGISLFMVLPGGLRRVFRPDDCCCTRFITVP